VVEERRVLDEESVIVRTHHTNRQRDWEGWRAILVDYIEGLGWWETEQRQVYNRFFYALRFAI